MSIQKTKIGPDERDHAKVNDSTDLLDQLENLVPSGTPLTKVDTEKQGQNSGMDFIQDGDEHVVRDGGVEVDEFKEIIISDDGYGKSNPDGQFDENTLKTIQQSHIDNNMETLQFTDAKDFMKGVMYQVPLSKLYRPIASCQFNDNKVFCPILVKIIDETILKENNGLQYLLQVWNVNGEMIFEKSLEKPVCNWNICSSRLMFMEEPNSNILWLVRLSMDRKSTIFKLLLPSTISDSAGVQINSVFDPEKQNFTIPPEAKLSNLRNLQNNDSSRQGGFDESQSLFSENSLNKSRVKDFNRMKSLGEIQLDTEEFDDHVVKGHIDEGPSITQIFKNKPFIERAPDKMLDYLNGYILLAYQNQIVYINVCKLMDIDSSQEFVETEIKDEDLDYINLEENFKIIAMQEIGSKNMSSIILENIESRQIRFLRIELPVLKSDGERRQLKFYLLGINQNAPTLVKSPLLKYRSVAKTDFKTKKHYQVGIALRMNGTFEVYSDFMLVNEHMNPRLQCVDIETDFQHFYLKFVKDSHMVKSVVDEIDIEIRQVRHIWRNRISFSTTRIKKQVSKWSWVLHRKISKFFRMYSQILNFNKYMLVSHRNMVSIYDMTQHNEQSGGSNEKESRGCWVKTINFGDSGQVRSMFIKKKDKQYRYELRQKKQSILHENSAGPDRIHLNCFEKYSVLCIIGSHSIAHVEINQDGTISQSEISSAPGRIIRFMSDNDYPNIMIVMTDDVLETKEYTDKDEGRLYNFPYTNSGTVQTLHSLKFNKFHTLLVSTESTFGECLRHDSKFAIMQSNKHVFTNNFEAMDPNASEQEIDDKDAVQIAFKKKSKISVLICTSITNSSCFLFPIHKNLKDVDIGDQQGKVVDSVKLITQNSKQLPLNDADLTNHSDHLCSFFVNTDKFADGNDHFAQVTEKQINVYNSKMKNRATFEGLNIRGCVDVHDNYLYTISDAIVKPPTVQAYKKQQNEDNEQKAFSPSGFYVYDVEALFKGAIQKYKLVSTIGGQANLIDDSVFGDRFSFIQSFDNIVMIPFPHLNILNCVGMGHKKEYMIWREKNGFFTALDSRNNLLTWSLMTGKMLYSETQHHDGSEANIKPYEVYRADDQDIVYTQDFYNFPDYSLNLLKSKVPANKELFYPHTNIQVDFEKYQERARKKEQRVKDGTQVDKFQENVTQLTADLFETKSNNLAIEVINSQKRSDLYHFKVMKLQTHEDLDRERMSSCKVLFHFFHELLQFQKQKDLEDFDWDVNSMPKQRLYLSKDTQMMMKVTNNFIAIVYKRKNIDQLGMTLAMNVLTNSSKKKSDDYEIIDMGQEVEWEEQYQIARFPTGLSEQTSVPYLFSPNFKYFLDFNYNSREFVIKESSTQFEYFNFPKDLINTLWNKSSGSNALKIIVSRFKWEQDNIFRIINRSNIDCIFELTTTDPNDWDKSQRSLKLISAVKIDNLHQNYQKLDSPHVFQEPCTLQSRAVLDRLIRQSQSYKSGVLHALNKDQVDNTLRNRFNMLHKINKIDYLQKLDDFHASFDIELTFTWLNWRIMDMLESGASVIEDVDHEQQIEICFNILPGGRSFLHMLAAGNSNSTASDQIKSYHTTKVLFQVASKNQDLELTGALDGCAFEIPLLPDIYGETALDLTLGIFINQKKIFFPNEIKNFNLVENLAMAEVILEGIKNYGFMHSSFFIVEAVIRATELGLPAIKDYLERRLKSIDHSFGSKTEHAFITSQQRFCPAMGDYARMFTNIWTPENLIRSKLFDSTKSLQPMTMLYLDMPFIFEPNERGYEFIYALTECEQLDIFRLKSVQIIIDCHATHWNRINYVFVGLPMLFNLLNFWYWSNIVLVNLHLDKETFQSHDLVCRILLGTTAFYLIFIEITAIIKKEEQYFNDMARLFNIITPVLIMTNVFTEDDQSTTFWTIQTWAALAIWFRALLYLRTIKKFSWLIRMIVACVLDMRTFLVVLTIGIVAFADAFLSIDQIMILRGKAEEIPIDPDASWYFKFFRTYVVAWQNSFDVALGGGGNDLENYREIDWFVFLLCSLFNIIVMLNLLIAIISETYQNIADDKEANGYQEKAQQISMMQDMLFGQRKKVENPRELVFIAKVISSRDIEDMRYDTKDRIEVLQDDVSMIKRSLKALVEKQ